MARKTKSQEDKDGTPKYVVDYDQVGEFRRGETVHADELPLAEDGSVDQDNIDRLILLGALIPHADVAAPETMTLAEAVRTDSPPTLPIVPASVETTPQELATAISPDNTTVTGPLPDAQ